MKPLRSTIVCGLALAATAGACSDDKAGLMVSVDLAEFGPSTRILKIAIAAKDDGFEYQGENSMHNVGVSTEDIDGDGTLELVTTFVNPGASVSFRVATGNKADLQMTGHAVAFDETKMIAGADSLAPVPLPAGGSGSLALMLTTREPGIVGP